MSQPASERLSPDPALVERCLTTLRRRPAGLITDIDGTVSAIASRPEAAFVSAEVRQTLARLAGRLALVAAVSGRSATGAAGMIGVPELVYVGNHGMERDDRGTPWVHPVAVAAKPAVAAALVEVEAEARATGHAVGLIVENKGVSGTVHYRLAPDPERARDGLLPLALAAAVRHGLIVTEGRMIVELRPNVVVNKGTAIVDLVAAHALRGVVFFGDDLTDVDGFVALRTLRKAGDVATLRLGVLGPETPPEVLAETDLGIEGVAACAALLAALADELEADAAADHDSLAIPDRRPSFLLEERTETVREVGR